MVGVTSKRAPKGWGGSDILLTEIGTRKRGGKTSFDISPPQPAEGQTKKKLCVQFFEARGPYPRDG